MVRDYEPKSKRKLFDDLEYALDDYEDMVERHGEFSKDAAQCEKHLRWLCEGAIKAGMAPEYFEQTFRINGKARHLKWRFGDESYWDALYFKLKKELKELDADEQKAPEEAAEGPEH